MAEPFSSFYQQSKDRVFRAVLATTKSRHDAEDLTAEAFARAYSKWSTVGVHPNPAGWVVKTALNQHRSNWRKLKRLVPLGEANLGHFAPPESPDPIVDQVIGLPVRQREAVALCVLLGLDSASAAEVLGVSASTVRVHLHRALASLRAVQEKEDKRS